MAIMKLPVDTIQSIKTMKTKGLIQKFKTSLVSHFVEIHTYYVSNVSSFDFTIL